MSNPITDMIKRSMETQASRQVKFEERVAKSAIDAQQLFDERHGPGIPHQYWRTISSKEAFNRFYISNSALKAEAHGHCNSFEAGEYYATMGIETRDALLKELASE